MSINQINPEFNDAYETYFPKMGILRRVVFKVFTKALESGISFRRKAFGGVLLVNERIVEYPLIFRWLEPRPGARVLDIGCCSSRLPIQLASLGYEVHGLDIQEYRFHHPNFHFHQSDIFQWTPEHKFDTVIAVSAIEHFGLGGYGDIMIKDGDIRAVEKISTFLAQKGQLLASMPFGKAGITPKHRIYDSERLKRLFRDFDFISEAYFQRMDQHWVPSSAIKLSTVDSLGMPPNGVVILNLRLRT